MKYYKKLCDGILVILNVLMGLMMLIMVVSISVQVFARFLFKTGYLWTDEAARFALVWMVVLGACVASYQNDHVNINLLDNAFCAKKGFFKKENLRYLTILRSIFMMVCAGLILFYSMEQMEIAALSVSTNIKMPMTIPYGVFPAAFACMLVMQLYVVLHTIFEKDTVQMIDDGGDTSHDD